jgi:hypothetical protein
MNIPESSLQPFEPHGIPTLMLIVHAPDSLEYIFDAAKQSLNDAIDRWHVIQRARACGVKLSVEWPIDLLELRTKLAGGKDVKCSVTELMDMDDKPTGFFMSITFGHPDRVSRFGVSIDYPDGEMS